MAVYWLGPPRLEIFLKKEKKRIPLNLRGQFATLGGPNNKPKMLKQSWPQVFLALTPSVKRALVGIVNSLLFFVPMFCFSLSHFTTPTRPIQTLRNLVCRSFFKISKQTFSFASFTLEKSPIDLIFTKTKIDLFLVTRTLYLSSLS